MADFITQEEFNEWCPDSLAPSTHEVTVLKIPIDIIEKHYANWAHQWGEDVQDQMYVQFSRKQVMADLSWVNARREDLPGLLLPQNMVQDRSLFCETDSEWTAVFEPSPLSVNAAFPPMKSLLEYIHNIEGVFDRDAFSYVCVACKPRVHIADECEYISDSTGAPVDYFASNGFCRIHVMDNAYISDFGNPGRSVRLGHYEHELTEGGRYTRPGDGYRFLREEGYDELDIDSVEFISELPDSFDDIDKEPVMGPEIWNIFGFREMEMICADFGIRPFDKDFYSDRGLLTTMWFENEPRFTAAPRVDFKHYQRMIGVGPDIIRSR